MIPAPVCLRCLHSAESHMDGDRLSCVHCALSPLAHAMGLACGEYTPRRMAHYGASCRAPRCECDGYCPRAEEE